MDEKTLNNLLNNNNAQQLHQTQNLELFVIFQCNDKSKKYKERIDEGVIATIIDHNAGILGTISNNFMPVATRNLDITFKEDL